MAKNEHYRNFSNRESFNGVPCRSDEELVPAVLTKEMKVTLKPLGLNYDNVETWTFRHGKKVPVVFIPNKKGLMDVYMTFFNSEVERYLKHLDKTKVMTSDGYIPPEEYNDEFGSASLKPEDYSDIGEAKVLSREYGNELKFTNATDYLRYDGDRWCEDKQLAVGATEEFLDLQLADAEDEQLKHL